MHQVRRTLGTVVLLLMCGLASAQDAPEHPFAAMRNKSVVSEDERTQIREWLSSRVSQIADASRLRAGAEIRVAAEGQDGYRAAFSEIAVQLVAAALPEAKSIGAAQLIALLADLERVETIDTLLQALQSDHAAVRAAAAAGLQRLRPQIVRQGGGSSDKVIGALEAAATKETSPVALEAELGALDFTGTSNFAGRGRMVAALLKIVRDRGAAYQAGEPIAEAAEAPALRLLIKLANDLDENQKKQAAEAAGWMLKYATAEYAKDLVNLDELLANSIRLERRKRFELIMMQAETLLKTLLSPPSPAPSISDAIKTQGDADKLRDLWSKWAEVLQASLGKDFASSESATASGG